jgi:hypothetical protein
MGVRKTIKSKDENLDRKQKDVDKIHYLFFHRIFSIEDIEGYFKGKYTYNEIKKIIKEKINGR